MRHLAVVLGLAFVVGCQAQVPGGGTKKRDGGTQPPDFSGEQTSGNCGGAAQMCCAGQVCDVGLQCNPRTGGCCAATGNACAGPQDCCAGLSCTAGRCCTAIGAACGAPGDCCTGLTCTAGVCDKPSGTCGDVGKPCCSGNTCSSGNVCVSGMCKACGAMGQSCCDSMTCNKGLTCDSGTCNAPCGDTGQACCKTGMPCKTTSLTCDAASQTCKSTTGKTTGGLNQPCNMPGNTCDTGLSCVANKCQMTSTCNTVGVTCCSGNTCSGGLVCNTGTNKCQMPGMTCTVIQAVCSTTSQCCPNLTCTNTIQPDHSQAKSCCVGVGAACPDGDFDCCGYLTCEGGKCTAGPDGDPCLSNDDCVSKKCTSGTCTSSGSSCGSLKPVTTACNNSSECCTGSVCEAVSGTTLQCCYQKGNTCANHAQCCGTLLCGSDNKCACAMEGIGCNQDDDCCSGLTCQDFTCRVPGTSMIPPGGLCMNSVDCQDTNGTSYYCFSAAGTSTRTCCTQEYQITCTDSSQCCGPSICASNTTATVCCSPVGEFCNGAYDCCGSATCNSNTCQ